MEKVLYVIPIIIFFMPLKELVMAERLNKHLKEKSDNLELQNMQLRRKISQQKIEKNQYGMINDKLLWSANTPDLIKENDKLLWSANTPDLIKELVIRLGDDGEPMIVPHFSVDAYGRKQLMALIPRVTFFTR